MKGAKELFKTHHTYKFTFVERKKGNENKAGCLIILNGNFGNMKKQIRPFTNISISADLLLKNARNNLSL